MIPREVKREARHPRLPLPLLHEKVAHVQVDIAADLSGLEKQEFWTVMEHRQWTHPYDARGRRRSCKSLPKRLTALADDPYRYAGMLGLLTAAFVDLDAATNRDRLAIACPLFGLPTPPALPYPHLTLPTISRV